MSDDIDAFALREHFENMKKRRHECDCCNKSVTFIEWKMQQIADLEASLETEPFLSIDCCHRRGLGRSKHPTERAF